MYSIAHAQQLIRYGGLATLYAIRRSAVILDGIRELIDIEPPCCRYVEALQTTADPNVSPPVGLSGGDSRSSGRLSLFYRRTGCAGKAALDHIIR